MFRKLMKSKALRQRTSWLLAIVLIPPFIFFFHLFTSSPTSGGRGDAAGMLFGKPVSWDRYQAHYLQVRRQWAAQFAGPDGRPIALPNSLEPLIAQAAWDRLLLVEEAKALRMRISDQELADTIRQTPFFQVDGRFEPERYRQFLAAMGVGSQDYERLVREQLLIDRLVDRIKEEVAVTDEDVHAEFVKANERLTVAAMLLEPKAFEDAARGAITEEELRAEYDAHPERVQTPAQVTFEYAGLAREALAKTLAVSEEAITQYYEAHREDFTQDGQVRPLDEVREEIRTQLAQRPIARRLSGLALDLEDALKAGATFDELVASYALARHTVGPLTSGTSMPGEALEPGLLQAAYSLEEGRMSGVIETASGVYVLRVTQRIGPQTPPFDAVRETIRRRLVEERARQRAQARAEEMRTELTKRLGAGETLEAATASLGVEVKRPAPFTRNESIEGLDASPGLSEAAFQVPQGQVSGVLEAGQAYALLVPTERQAPDEAKLAEQQESLRQRLLEEQQNAHVSEWLAALRERAKLESFVESAAPNYQGNL